MSSMDNLVSEYFAQDTGSSNLEKQAQVELFAKIAANNGIDLEKLSEEQVAYLWNETFKTAEPFEGKETPKEEKEEEEAKKKEEEKKAAAENEFAEKRAAAAKLAEAEYLGRYMAHAMTDEIKKIAAAQVDTTKEAGKIVDKLKNLGTKGLEAASGSKAKSELAEARRAHGAIGESVTAAKLRDAAHSSWRKGGKNIAIGAGGAAAAAGVAKGVHSATKDEGSKKKASAIDELAAERAVVKAAEAGFDSNEAAERLGAVLTLGIDESEKIAAATDLETGIEIRSLELLEAAGYPVTWNA